MFNKSLFILSNPTALKMKYASKFLLILLLLASLIQACSPTNQAPGQNTVSDNTVVQLSGPEVLSESGTNPLPANVSKSDIGMSQCVIPPLLTYTTAGVTIPRRSELGILADPDDLPQCITEKDVSQESNASAAGMSQCTSQPLLTYTTAGVTIPRRSELGILANPDDILPPCIVEKDVSQESKTSVTGTGLCGYQPLLTYTTAGVTVPRRSELGLLADPDDYIPAACPDVASTR